MERVYTLESTTESREKKGMGAFLLEVHAETEGASSRSSITAGGVLRAGRSPGEAIRGCHRA